MKILITSDWHLHPYTDHHQDRLGEQLKAIQEIFDYAYNEGIDTVVVGGDLGHQPKSIPNVLLVRLMEFFEQLFESYPNMQVLATTGNHTLGVKAVKDAECLYSLELVLSKIFKKNFKLIDYKNYHLGHENFRIVGIPYMEHKEDFIHLLRAASENLVEDCEHTLIIHQTPNLQGLNIPMDFDVTEPLLQGFTKVFCGHIHKHKPLSDKVTLIGTPYQLSFSEGGEDVKNGFLVYDLYNHSTQFVELHCPKFIEVTEGQEIPLNQFVRVIPKPIYNTLSDKLQDKEVFSTTSAASIDRAKMVEAYCQSEGIEPSFVEVGLRIISKVDS